MEGLNKFQNNLLEFCSFSSKQSSETNSLLFNLSKKIDKTFQLGGSDSSASSSSTSIASSSSSRISSLEAESSLFERSLVSALKGSMPGIREVLTRQSVVAPDKIL